jgi:hypothetical protein
MRSSVLQIAQQLSANVVFIVALLVTAGWLLSPLRWIPATV